MTIDNYKLISFDLDGTLLNDNLRLTNYSKNNISNLINNKILCAIISSRPLRSIQTYTNDIKLAYISGLNGAIIYNNHTKKTEKMKFLDNFSEIVDYIIHQKIIANIFCEKNNYSTDFSSDPTNRKYQISLRTRKIDLRKLDEKILSIELILDSSIKMNKIHDAIKLRFKNINIKKSGYNYLEINSKNVDKGRALNYIADKLDVTLEEIIAIGDSEADLPMLKIAGLGVLMKNSNASIKKKIPMITEFNNNNDGAIKFIINKIYR